MDTTSREPGPGFDALPGWGGADGGARKAGFELEFAGLTPREAAETVQDVIGGRIETRDGRDIVLQDSEAGGLKIYLDTALRKRAKGAIAEAGLDLGRAIVPVEIVTPPLESAQWPLLDRMRRALCEAGATGTGGGLLLGFGLHLNPELADPEGADLPHVGAAYALMEDWLRDRGRIDISRRLMPFTQRYPASWLDWIASSGDGAAPRDFAESYLRHNPSRNHGLDLLPAIRALWPDLFEKVQPRAGKVSARPAYHVRSPDCRIDEPGWSVALEWNRWVLVETAARDGSAMAALRDAWRARSGPVRRLGSDWTETAARILREHGLSDGDTA